MAHTPQPKSLALMFLLGAFLTGGALGFVADRAIAKKPYSRTFSQKDMRDELARELTLSPVQRASIDSILDWRNNRNRELMTPVRPLMDANRDSARVLISQQLDSTQQRKFRELLERMRAQDKSRNQKGAR